ncbi:MAG: hypothetical protein NTX42_00895 [Methanothrix sp.]|nr:hypothetical protein [Methanothrix sp.]
MIYPAMDCKPLLEWFGEEECLGKQVAGTDEERLLAMIEALGDKPLHAISIKGAHRKIRWNFASGHHRAGCTARD